MTPRQLVKRISIGVLAATLLAFIADYAYLRLRMAHPKASDPVEKMTRNRLLAIPLKSGKLDYEPDQVQPTDTLTCVHSLFPHYGYAPCWYLKPRVNDPIPVG